MDSSSSRDSDIRVLKLLGEDLNRALDQLNAEILETEDFLESLNVGERVEIPIDSDTTLVFGKSSSKWKLRVQSSDGVSELTNVSKELRIRACKFIPEILLKMKALGGQRLTEVNEASSLLKNLRW